MAFDMMDSYGYGMGGGMLILGLIFWILVIIGLISHIQEVIIYSFDFC